jgi:hypothetical protein
VTATLGNDILDPSTRRLERCGFSPLPLIGPTSTHVIAELGVLTFTWWVSVLTWLRIKFRFVVGKQEVIQFFPVARRPELKFCSVSDLIRQS